MWVCLTQKEEGGHERSVTVMPEEGEPEGVDSVECECKSFQVAALGAEKQQGQGAYRTGVRPVRAVGRDGRRAAFARGLQDFEESKVVLLAGSRLPVEGARVRHSGLS
jgi:hypothetical protein